MIDIYYSGCFVIYQVKIRFCVLGQKIFRRYTVLFGKNLIYATSRWRGFAIRAFICITWHGLQIRVSGVRDVLTPALEMF